MAREFIVSFIAPCTPVASDAGDKLTQRRERA